MLKRIPKCISPELLDILMRMGHGDEVLLADANYPALYNNNRVIRADGIDVTTILKAILELMPLDTYSDYQGILMETVPGDKNIPNGNPPVWNNYRNEIINVFPEYKLKKIERQSFYNYSRQIFAIVQTGETALYGNLILRKGVVL